MVEKLDLQQYINIAYKKLKASVYFDKTQLALRNNIVLFETGNIDEKLNKLFEMLADEEAWKAYEIGLLNQIGTFVFPKKLRDYNKSKSGLEDAGEDSNDVPIIFNRDNEPVELEKAQYFIDLPVEGHIISVLWVLTVGRELDQNGTSIGNMYEHSYGNRLRKTLINPETGDITYSPNLFEPYFSQYESWRDRALAYATSSISTL